MPSSTTTVLPLRLSYFHTKECRLSIPVSLNTLHKASSSIHLSKTTPFLLLLNKATNNSIRLNRTTSLSHTANSTLSNSTSLSTHLSNSTRNPCTLLSQAE